MVDVVNMCKSVMKRAVHGLIFRSAVQFGQWFYGLPKVAESLNDGSDDSLEERPNE